MAGERGELHPHASIELECKVDVARNAARLQLVANGAHPHHALAAREALERGA